MLEEMNKENNSDAFISSNNENNLVRSDGSDAIRIEERIQNRPVNPLVNQIDLNRQINNLNRVNNNNVNNEIHRQANDEPNDTKKFVPKMSDSIPISPEAFLKFFSL